MIAHYFDISGLLGEKVSRRCVGRLARPLLLLLARLLFAKRSLERALALDHGTQGVGFSIRLHQIPYSYYETRMEKFS